MQPDTQTFTLPVSKLEVTIKEADGYSDRLLLRRNRKPHEVFPEYLASMTVSLGENDKVRREDILNLLLPDQEYLAIECFKLNYGDLFEFELTCANCEKTAGYSFDMNSLPYFGLPEELAAMSDPVVTATLPRSQKEAVVGMLNGKKEALLIEHQLASGMIDLPQASFQALRSLDGQVNFSFEDVGRLKAADQKALRKARQQLKCGYDTEINVRCEHCGEKNTVNILMHKDFLLPAG